LRRYETTRYRDGEMLLARLRAKGRITLAKPTRRAASLPSETSLFRFDSN
jgi:hypothetical protein